MATAALAASSPGLLRDLVPRARALLRLPGSASFPAAPASRLDVYHRALASRRQPAPELVLPTETALELGSPRRAACHGVLWTDEAVTDGEVSLLGPDLSTTDDPDLAYGQVVILGLSPGATVNPLRADALQFLTRRLPGVMARALPDRLWLRVSRDAATAGIDFALIGAALRRAYREELPGVAGVECLFVTRHHDVVQDLAAIAAEARIRTGRHPRLRPGRDGDYECSDLTCDDCDEQPVCDRIRAVAAIRRQRREVPQHAAPPPTPGPRSSHEHR